MSVLFISSSGHPPLLNLCRSAFYLPVLRLRTVDSVSACSRPRASRSAGVFILNLVARDAALGDRARADLAATFAACVAYPVPEEVNEIVFCLRRRPDADPCERIRSAAAALNAALSRKQRGKSRQSFMDMSAFAQELRKL